MLSGKNILLGITGGISAYKAAELCRQFVKAGAAVRVVMTSAAKEFITPLTMQTVSSHQVYDDLFAAVEYYKVEHIGLSREADLFVIAPATANTIAKIAHGIADNLLTTTVMAADCPILLAPAMNTNMYNNPILQENLHRLTALGYHLIGPAEGELACGDSGRGRMSSVEEIFSESNRLLTKSTPWQKKRVLVTAGPTREALDPVRYLTNHSSGKMGYAIAEALQKQGAVVTLISGPVQLQAPAGVTMIFVNSAQDMYDAVISRFSDIDVVIKAAAVADYRPTTTAFNKLKKARSLTVDLVANPDILLELGRRKKGQILVGFAAETDHCAEFAKEKLVRKNLDLIVANDVTKAGAGFDADTNIVSLYFADGKEKHFDLMSKRQVAEKILRELEPLLK